MLQNELYVGATVVLNTEDSGYLILWNGEETFDLVAANGDIVECFTAYPKNLPEAVKRAEKWFKYWCER